MKIDSVIMGLVDLDDDRWRNLKKNSQMLVGTGVWKLWEQDDGVYVSYTDDYTDEVIDVVVMEDCKLVEGERLVFFTSVHKNGDNYGLVLFQNMAYKGEQNPVEAIE